MNLMARLIGMWRGQEDAAAGGEDLELTPGLDRELEAGAREREQAEEHEEPE